MHSDNFTYLLQGVPGTGQTMNLKIVTDLSKAIFSITILNFFIEAWESDSKNRKLIIQVQKETLVRKSSSSRTWRKQQHEHSKESEILHVNFQCVVTHMLYLNYIEKHNLNQRI